MNHQKQILQEHHPKIINALGRHGSVSDAEHVAQWSKSRLKILRHPWDRIFVQTTGDRPTHKVWIGCVERWNKKLQASWKVNPHPKEENERDDFTDSLDALDVDPGTIDIGEVSDELR